MNQMSWRTPVRRWTVVMLGALLVPRTRSALGRRRFSKRGRHHPEDRLVITPEEASTVAVGVCGTGKALPTQGTYDRERASNLRGECRRRRLRRCDRLFPEDAAKRRKAAGGDPRRRLNCRREHDLRGTGHYDRRLVPARQATRRRFDRGRSLERCRAESEAN